MIVTSLITLTVGAQRVRDFSLRVGGITEVVEVTSAASAVQLGSSTLKRTSEAQPYTGCL